MQPQGTLTISIPINTAWGGKLVTVMRVPNLTEDEAKDFFAEWKALNQEYRACGAWKQTRIVFM